VKGIKSETGKEGHSVLITWKPSPDLIREINKHFKVIFVVTSWTIISSYGIKIKRFYKQEDKKRMRQISVLL